MLYYELLHLTETLLLVFIGVFGGVYAFKSLRLLYRNREGFKNQQGIWVPILVAGGFFSISGIFHLSEHFLSISEINVLSELTLVAGLFFQALSIFRYWRLQEKYNEVKHEGLRKIAS